MPDKQTWKETKQAYLLMLIKEGDLSNKQLDSLIGETERMTSDRGALHAATVEDMGRVVEAHVGGDNEAENAIREFCAYGCTDNDCAPDKRNADCGFGEYFKRIEGGK